MRGGAKIRIDVVRQDQVQHQWVKKNIEPQNKFDAEKEKETFKEAKHEFLKKNIASTSSAQQNQNSPM
jgi:hypothetical protein